MRIYAEPCRIRRMYEVQKFVTATAGQTVNIRFGYRCLRLSGMDAQAARWCLIALWLTPWQYTSPSVTK